MRFQKSVLLYAFSLVLAVFLFSPILPSANAQLNECTCANSLQDTCADGFRVSYLGQIGDTFRYEVCNDPGTCGVPPMALSHADIVITDSTCIPNDSISTIMIGTDGLTQTSCDDPVDKDKSCGVENLVNQELIKCNNTDGVFEPTLPGQCITIEITIDNADGIGIMEGPSLALNKAGQECGQGCLLGPTCGEACTPPVNPCEVTVVKDVNGNAGGVNFDFDVNFGSNPPDDFMFSLNPPATPSLTFQIPGDNSATITETGLPAGWSIQDISCDDSNTLCTDFGSDSVTCFCPAEGLLNATCTFSNIPPDDPETCDIVIEKQTDPNGSTQSFDFTSSQGPANFSLQDEGTQNIPGIPLGVLTVVQETLPDNWVLDNITCVGGDQGQFVVDVDDEKLVRITCDSTGTKTCTFDNREIPPPPPTGCCLEGDFCTNDVESGNCGGTFDENALCGEGLCAVEPLGCCFLEPIVAFAEAATKEVDPEKCVEVNQVMCDNINGIFQGPGTMCTQFPDECDVSPIVPTDVPTLGQWGMIVIAAFLGIYSFMVLRKRNKLNVG